MTGVLYDLHGGAALRRLIKKCETVSNGIVDIYRRIPDAYKQNAAMADLLRLCMSMRKNLSLPENTREVGVAVAGLNGAMDDIRFCELAIQSLMETGLASKELADPVLQECKALRKMIDKKIENISRQL